MKAQLWVIQCGGFGDWWTDDNGGFLFASPAMAQRVFDKWLLGQSAQYPNAKIVECGLDPDLAQMGNLYHD